MIKIYISKDNYFVDDLLDFCDKHQIENELFPIEEHKDYVRKKLGYVQIPTIEMSNGEFLVGFNKENRQKLLDYVKLTK